MRPSPRERVFFYFLGEKQDFSTEYWGVTQILSLILIDLLIVKIRMQDIRSLLYVAQWTSVQFQIFCLGRDKLIYILLWDQVSWTQDY
jgi:hypothetical protein